MISDETFPIMIDIEDDQLYSLATNGDTLASTDTFETSVNSSGVGASNTDVSSNPPTSAESCTKRNDYFEYSFASIPSSRKLNLQPPPHAPIKQKKSFSCHDLQQKKPSYEHIESKVKKDIVRSSLEVEERRRKILSRHKSMPISSQPSLDETFSDDPNALIREVRKKSIQIYELQEKSEEKDSRIYALEYEKSKMKMTFDKLRVDIHELKEKEKQYKRTLAASPQMRILKNAITQTENDQNVSHIRELTFSNDTTVFLNQTHFSELNNASSDNLIPEVILDDITKTDLPEEEEIADEPQEEKKKKKFRRFFKLISCVSK